jgi:hypothetical protein
MTREMNRKNIEISRITKTAALLLMSGLSPESIDSEIFNKCIQSQRLDGGFVGNSDTVWNICFLKYYEGYNLKVSKAIKWLSGQSNLDGGFGRNVRDMSRIPVTGLILYLINEINDNRHFRWLEKEWESEVNSLTYKAAYTLLAFNTVKSGFSNENLKMNSIKWLASQQEDSGGFGPWLKHPAGADIYCTSIAALGLMTERSNVYSEEILKSYEYMKKTQLDTGIWPYHEIEDGSSWGLYAMTKIEEKFGDKL